MQNKKLQTALVENYTTNAGPITKEQIGLELYFQWTTYISALYNIGQQIMKRNDWKTVQDLNTFPENQDIFELLQMIYNLLGEVNGYLLRRDSYFRELILAYISKSSPRVCKSESEKLSVLAQFRLNIENYFARQIMIQNSKTQKILEDESEDIHNIRRMKVSRKRKLKNTSDKHTPRAPRKIEFTTVVVLCSTYKCSKNHHIEPVQASINIVHHDGSIREASVSAGYCKTCDLFFLLEADYRALRDQGVLLCQLISRKIYETGNLERSDVTELSPESLLHRSGYNVNSANALTSHQRQQILKHVLDSGLYSASGLISFLDWLIRRNSNISTKNMESALAKWKADRMFVANYRA